MKPGSPAYISVLVPFSLLLILFFTHCNQDDKSQKDIPVADTVKVTDSIPAITPDTTLTEPVKPVTDTTAIKPEKQEKITPPKTPEPVKPITTQPVPPPVKKTDTITKKVTPPAKVIPPVENKPAPEPVKPPVPIVKEPEPVKPAPVPEPVVTPPQAPTDWVVPAKYKGMTNPYPVNAEFTDLGRSVYGQHCKSCHGGKGDGNGPKAATIDTKINSFLTASFRSQKPGEVYYKSIIGRKDMPSYEKKIKDEEERWAVVYYIMNMK